MGRVYLVRAGDVTAFRQPPDPLAARRDVSEAESPSVVAARPSVDVLRPCRRSRD